jgi:hypothetical protein
MTNSRRRHLNEFQREGLYGHRIDIKISHLKRKPRARPSFLQYLNKLFQIQISAGDIIQFESGNTSKYHMLSATGSWDKIIKLQ